MAKGNPDPAVLVRKSWAERVDAATKESAKEVATERGKQEGDASLFYDVRPVKVITEWTRVSTHLAKADAIFMDKDGNEENEFVFPIYACRYNAVPPGRLSFAVQWAIWRGRWELLSNVPASDFSYFALKRGNGIGLYAGTTPVAQTASAGGTYEIRNAGVLSFGGISGNALTGYVRTDATFFDITTGAAPAVTLKTKATKFVYSVTLPTFETQVILSGLLNSSTRLEVTRNDAGLVTNVELVKHTSSVSGLVKTADGAVYDSTYNFVRE